MPHIQLPENMPGISAGFAYRPETAKPMRELAHVLLHTSGNNGFSSGDRELIASFVSSRNTCHFCQASHGAAAAHLHGGNVSLVDAVCRDYRTAPISEKLKALLAIAEQIQIDGKRVTKELVDQAQTHGASDLDIHDTVLIAAAFCMYNRYVDGLATWQPQNEEMYLAMGKQLAEQGYSRPSNQK
ncbi:MAG TPA: peroxidase-related enzyme [Terriglobales bacterium]|nr:peroxidase-related enzyme [Terriglobales bacterium]